MMIYRTIHVSYSYKSHDSLKKQINSLFNCHTIGLSEIAPNMFGAKLSSIRKYYILYFFLYIR